MIQTAMKAAAKGDYAGGRKKLDDAESFVKSKSLGGNFETTIQADREQIGKVESNKALAATLNKSNDLFDSANKGIAGGQWDSASQALDQLQGLGEGAAHKDEIAGLRAQIDSGKKIDAAFSQAQGQAKSTDKNTLLAAKSALDAIANSGGRHSADAKTLSGQVTTAINNIDAAAAKAEADKAVAAKADHQRQVDDAVKQIRALKDQHKFSDARSLLPKLSGLGEDPAPYKSEIDSAEAGMKSAVCTVVDAGHRKLTIPFKPGSEQGQAFLDDSLKLSAGANCGFSPDVLQPLPKGEWSLLVSIDTDGKVLDAQALTGDASSGGTIVQNAKRSWHFNAPKINNTPVKTRAAVKVSVN